MQPAPQGSALRLLAAASYGFLVLLVVYPTLSLLVRSLLPGGSWGLDNYLSLLSSPIFARLFCQSIMVSAGSALVSTMLGTLLAVLVVKTAAPMRRFFALAAVLPIIIPGFITSIAYIFLFGRNGLVTYIWLGIDWDVYSWKSVFILQCVDQTSTAFLLMAAALAGTGGRLEEAARTLGAGEWRILWTVTLALARPMFLAAFLLNFMHAMGDFGTPLIVGGPFDTLASASYTQLVGRYDLPMAATLNVLLLIVSVTAYGGYSLLVKRGTRTELSWRSEAGGGLQLTGPAARCCWCLGFAFVLFVTALLAAVCVAAFARQMGSGFAPTLDYFRSIGQRGLDSTWNTFLFALAVGLAVSLLGQLLAHLVVEKRIAGRQGLDFLATIPFALPGTCIGVGYAIAFNTPPLLLTGTWFLVLMNLVVRKLPLGFRAGASILARRDRSLGEASRVLGASALHTLFTVTLPALRPALLASALYAFVTTIQALGSIIFIITPGTKLLAVDVFEAVVRGEVGQAAAYSMIMLAMAASGGLALLTLFARSRMFLPAAGARKPSCAHRDVPNPPETLAIGRWT